MSNNLESQTIYDLFRSCRLCGAGGGYKMPIIPSVVGLEFSDIELRQKIRECVQIEVTPEDKMPPLICELCVDKVHDFYEFVEMCKQTNRQTRIRLGLPPQNLQSNTEASDCILGVTEQIYDQDDEPLSSATKVKIKKEKKGSDKKKDCNKKKNNENKKENERNNENPRVKSLRKELENLVMNDISPEGRSSKRPSRLESSSPGHTPGPASRRSRRPSPPAEDPPLSKISSKPQKKEKEEASSKQDKPGPRRFKMSATSSESPKPKPILKMDTKPILIDSDDDTPLPPRVKRPLTKAERKQEQMMDMMEPPVKKSKSSSKLTEDKASLSLVHACPHCNQSFRTRAALSSHCRFLHPFPQEPATNKPGKIKKGADTTKREQRKETDKQRKESDAGKRQLRRETETSKRESRKETETSKRELRKETEISKRELRKETDTSKPSKIESRETSPCGFKPFLCRNCNKCFQTKFGLKRHLDRGVCGTDKTKSGVTIDSNVKIPPAVLERLLPAQVRLQPCDALLPHKRKRCNVRTISQDFGFDTSCIYPYRSLVRVKQEPFASDFMVSINQDVKNEFYREEDYVHWDSDLSTDSDDEFPLLTPGEKKKKVPSLTKLSLKTLFSKRCLGKVPRKLRKVKNDEKFDSLFNTEFDDMQSDINNIIDNLDDTMNDNGENNVVNNSGENNTAAVESNDDKVSYSENNEVTIEKTDEKVSIRENDAAVVERNDDKVLNGENSETAIEETDEKVSISENDAAAVERNDNKVLNSENSEAAIEKTDENVSTIEENDDTASTFDDNYINFAKGDKNNDNDSINSFNINGEVNYESDSLLGKESRVNEADTDASTNKKIDNTYTNGSNNDNVSNTLSMHDSETDASVDTSENKYKSQSTTDVDSSQEEGTTQNGVSKNGVKPDELIDEIDNLIVEKSIIDAIDEQIYAIDNKIGVLEKKHHVSAKERENKISLDDIGQKSDKSMDLDSISDDEFNFDV